MNEQDEKLLRELSLPPPPVQLPPMTTNDKIATVVVTAILLLATGTFWAIIFYLVWAFTGWKP